MSFYNPAIAPTSRLTHVERAYKKHGIYTVPDPDLHESIPEPFLDMVQFEMDVTAAIILDGKSKTSKQAVKKPAQPKPPTTKTGVAILSPGEMILNRNCKCYTPFIGNEVMSVVFEDEPHAACPYCGRILSLPNGRLAFDERIVRRNTTLQEESFMVDQIQDSIIRSFRVSTHYLGRR